MNPSGQNPYASKKQFVYFLTTAGCGNHLLVDLFKHFTYVRFPESALHFWPTYVLAEQDPEIRSPFKPYTGQKSIEAIRSYYEDHQFPYSGDPLDLDLARAFFRTVIDDFPGDKLFVVHCYPFSHSKIYTFEDGEQLAWSLEDRNHAYHLLQRSLEGTDCDVKYIGFVRHPVDIFLSTRERHGIEDHSVLKRPIFEFFEVLDQQREKDPNEILVLKYEDICSKDQDAFSRLFYYLNFSRQVDVERELAFLHPGGIWKHKALPKSERLPLLAEFGRWIDRFDYCVTYSHSFFERAITQIRMLKNEIYTLNLVFEGNHTAGGAIFRHRWSFLAQNYLDLCWSLFPSFRQNLRDIYLNHYGVPCVKSYGFFNKVGRKVAGLWLKMAFQRSHKTSPAKGG